MFEDPPGCMLHRQASFLALPGSFPDDVIADLDNRRRRVPAAGPIEAGGSRCWAAATSPACSARTTRTRSRCSSSSPVRTSAGWVEGSGYISAHQSFDLSLQPNQTMRDISEIAYSASEFRFDGSDLMPGEVGAGSFWREMVAWAGGQSTDETLARHRGELAGP